MNINTSEPIHPTRPQQGYVAVIMRTKDRPLLLPRALGSVRLQSFPDWHLYLVNDGGDREALENQLALYRTVFGDQLTVIHHETSLGMEAASNAALAAGEEEFVVVHDDDDTWDVDFLRETVCFLNSPKNTHCPGVATDCVVINEEIEEGTVRETRRHIWKHDDGVVDYGKMLYHNPFAPICFLFRRSVLAQIGTFDAELPVLGDWDFNIRLIQEGDIGFIHQPLASYHLRQTDGTSIYSNSIIGSVSDHRLQNVLLRNRLLREMLDKQPELLGLLAALVRPVEDIREKIAEQENTNAELRRQMSRLEIQLDELKISRHELRPVLDANQQELRHLLHVALSDLDQIRIVATWQKKLMAPVYLGWRLALPARRLIAKLRGRT
ncbi:glycosyltransferase family 2 protein [Acetobacter oeni]|nr:glycosyltransferase [Acetobacter oeni]MBB3881287.1 glycosyltransferase involved in cell wall biosynthesis [Acetobacter oeni]GBR08085.1 glycosyltransferase [Acetobacter oeni LMG 21952]